jgi:hypothetical protein
MRPPGIPGRTTLRRQDRGENLRQYPSQASPQPHVEEIREVRVPDIVIVRGISKNDGALDIRKRGGSIELIAVAWRWVSWKRLDVLSYILELAEPVPS